MIAASKMSDVGLRRGAASPSWPHVKQREIARNASVALACEHECLHPGNLGSCKVYQVAYRRTPKLLNSERPINDLGLKNILGCFWYPYRDLQKVMVSSGALDRSFENPSLNLPMGSVWRSNGETDFWISTASTCRLSGSVDENFGEVLMEIRDAAFIYCSNQHIRRGRPNATIQSIVSYAHLQ